MDRVLERTEAGNLYGVDYRAELYRQENREGEAHFFCTISLAGGEKMILDAPERHRLDEMLAQVLPLALWSRRLQR